VLQIDSLTVRYGPIEAVRQVSILVEEGEMVALIGGNGAGKTSTLLAVSGVLPSAAGEVRLDGHTITGMPAHRIARRGLAQVVEGRAVFGTLTVHENLLAGSYPRTDRRAVRDDMERLLDRLPQLRQRVAHKAYTLSGGEQQMLAIARALMSRPRLLLLDEPSMGLAPLIAEGVFSMLSELHRGGLGILLVEQNAPRALALSSRAYVMANGEIVASGPAASLMADDTLRDLYLGRAPDLAEDRRRP
jgi:branched-chain amino acid transport system ATP-binding protein